MQDWDRLVMIVIGGGVAIYTGYQGWRLWPQGQRTGAVGAFVLAAATAALPVALAIYSR